MPQVYLRKEAYDRIIESGHRQDLEAFLVHAVDLAIEEVRQIPKSDPSLDPPKSLSFTSIPTPAPTVTSDTTISGKKPKRKLMKGNANKPVDPGSRPVGLFNRQIQCLGCNERFQTREDFKHHLPCWSRV